MRKLSHEIRLARLNRAVDSLRARTLKKENKMARVKLAICLITAFIIMWYCNGGL